MDAGTPISFTSVGIIVFLVILLVMFACHYLTPNANTWIRSNKEEKIGLSKNKLFHTNGYMLQSSSEILLSSSGSFKRFDNIGKEDYKQNGQHPQPHQQQQQQKQHAVQHKTTPLWNLEEADTNCAIPPQPLRPAPAPNSAGHNKTVTFSFSNIDEITSTDEKQDYHALNEKEANHTTRTDDAPLVSCLRDRNAMKFTKIPQALDAPPPPRLSVSVSATLSATAIPRPMTKRQLSLQVDHNIIGSNEQRKKILQAEKSPTAMLTRRNSSTNPFLCETLDSLPNSVAMTSTMNNAPRSKDDVGNTNTNKSNENCEINGTKYISNPFYEQNLASTKTTSNGTSHKNIELTNNHNITPIPQAKQTASILRNQPEPRNRSFSETEVSDSDLKTFTSKFANAGLTKLQSSTNPFVGLSQKVKKPHILQKTISEDFLLRKVGISAVNGYAQTTQPQQNGHSTWSFGRSLSLVRRNSSQCSLNYTGGTDSSGSLDSINLERAVSCDSVNSDSSVFLSDLDQPYTQITGYLCVGLQPDKESISNEGMEFTVSVLEAKGLICPFTVESLDTFVRIYLVPDEAGAVQTKIFKNSQTPCYNESFNFFLQRQQKRHSLWFHLYHNGEAHTLIGEAEMEITESLNPITTWIPLTDSRKCNAQWGELMFSLSYLPTAERLTIVVVKARNLKTEIPSADQQYSIPREVESIFVKVYLMDNERKLSKKRTSLKRKDRLLVFNESMIFNVRPQDLTTIQIRFTVYGIIGTSTVPLGHVFAGSCATGKGLRHWHQMLSSLRKPVAMWHVLRGATNQPIFTGGAEAVMAAMRRNVLHAKRNSVI